MRCCGDGFGTGGEERHLSLPLSLPLSLSMGAVMVEPRGLVTGIICPQAEKLFFLTSCLGGFVNHFSLFT
jgi:hypothetical protein